MSWTVRFPALPMLDVMLLRIMWVGQLTLRLAWAGPVWKRVDIWSWMSCLEDMPQFHVGEEVSITCFWIFWDDRDFPVKLPSFDTFCLAGLIILARQCIWVVSLVSNEWHLCF